MNILDEINRSIPIRRAYIWDRIIQLGFTPRAPKDQCSWILLFRQNLPSFWGIENQPVHGVKHSATEIRITYPGITHNDDLEFECRISNGSQFSVEIVLGETLWWVHDYDSRYYSPSSDLFSPFILRQTRGTPSIANTFKRIDIDAVIDGLILHPCAHQHIRHPVNEHLIRFGGGITNPYVYLFHLRYQLCPDQDLRDRERLRLTELFFNAINDNQPTISANELMAIP